MCCVKHADKMTKSADHDQTALKDLIIFGGWKSLFSQVRPDFFYFLVLGSADPIFLKTRIKIKVTLICFIFIFSADVNFPPQNEIKVD